ncbi:hypothetical protein GGI23_001885 [Coemansia sp. RSA 2559]|nr:hypothetical protein GGI23_001885 [Coemansia sp. RSA 2559]
MALLASRRRRMWRLSIVAIALLVGYLVATRLSQSASKLAQAVRYSDDIPSLPTPNAPHAAGCFVFVTRTASLTKVRRTMFDVEKRFNERHAYPYVFLSEHPFSDAFKRAVRKMTAASVHFAAIDAWQHPPWIVQTQDSSAWRHLVRFWAGPVALHPALRQFKYFWRLEPGAHYTCDIAYDPFRLMQDHHTSYGFAISLEAAVPYAGPTLWTSALEFIHSSLYNNSLHGNSLGWLVHPTLKDYNRCEFLTNFELVDLDFMRSAPYQRLFDFFDRKGGFYYEHWTDASIRSLAVAMLLRQDQVHWFEDIGYTHDLTSNCPAATESQMRCHCDPAKSSHLLPMSCSARWKTHAVSIPWHHI